MSLQHLSCLRVFRRIQTLELPIRPSTACLSVSSCSLCHFGWQHLLEKFVKKKKRKKEYDNRCCNAKHCCYFFFKPKSPASDVQNGAHTYVCIWNMLLSTTTKSRVKISQASHLFSAQVNAEERRGDEHGVAGGQWAWEWCVYHVGHLYHSEIA